MANIADNDVNEECSLPSPMKPLTGMRGHNRASNHFQSRGIPPFSSSNNNRHDGDGDGDDDTLLPELWNQNANETHTKKEKVEDPKRARILMTMIHFFLSYPRWSVSIFLFLASQSVPLLPDLSTAATVPYEALNNLTKAEANAYHECTVHAFQFLKEDMEETANREYKRVLSSRQSNQELLASIGSTTETCQMAGLKAREALFEWNVSEDQGIPFLVGLTTPHGVCSTEDYEYIETRLRVGQDFEELEGEVSSIVDGYTQSSESSFGVIKDYAEKRTAYDYDYFVKDRVEPVLELLEQLANADIFTVEFSFNPQHWIDDLLQHLSGFDATLSAAKIRLQLLSTRIGDFYLSLQMFVDAYNELYRRLVLARNFALEYLPNGSIDLPDFLELQGIPLASSLLPPIFEIPRFHTELAEFDILLRDFSAEALRMIVELIQRLQEVATEALASAVKAIIDQILELLTLEDYDPPKFIGSQPGIYTLDEEAAYLADIGDAAASSTQLALEKADALRNVTVGELPTDIPELETDNYTFSGNGTAFDYQDASLPKIRIPKLLRLLLAIIVAYRGWTDCIVHFARFFKLSDKYERETSPTTNEDVGLVKDKGDTKAKGGGEGSGSSTFGAGIFKHLSMGGIAKAATTGVTIFSVWVFLLVVFFSVLKFAVIPWYADVHQNCVASKNGTNLANSFIAPLVINQASAPGNLLHSQNEFECLNRQRQICDRMFVESESAYKRDNILLSALHHKINETNVWLSRLELCIDYNTLDSQFSEACCGLEGYSTTCAIAPNTRPQRCPIDRLIDPPAAFRTIGAYVSDPSCAVNLTNWELKDARFDCQTLENSCSKTPCNGVNEDLVHSLVIEADCLVQRYSTRIILFLCLVAFHAISLNLCLKFILDGMRYLNWKKLKKDGEFKAAFDKEGALLEAAASKEQRAEAIQKFDRRQRKTGWIRLIIGLTLIVVWGVCFAIITHHTRDFR